MTKDVDRKGGVDIYGGADPRSLPLFSYAEVARWLKMPYSTVRDRAKRRKEYRDHRKGVSLFVLYDLWNERNAKGTGTFEYEDDVTAVPTIYYPAEYISVNPRVAFGVPTVMGTGIKARVLAGWVAGGMSAAEVADEYGISEREVMAAVEFESNQIRNTSADLEEEG
jgi:uncharacterized protein (DUF433 family)